MVKGETWKWVRGGLAAGLLGTVAWAETVETTEANRVGAEAPAWRALAAELARQPDTWAEFTETRRFPFRREPTVLRGEVRVSREHGLSLRYLVPEERVVLLDARGLLVRDRHGEETAPDRRAEGANRALWHALRLDLTALTREFEVYGKTGDGTWALVLVPRDEDLRRSVGQIRVQGAGPAVRRIELYRSAQQHIGIDLGAPRPVSLTADELRRFFR